jgi:tetratricopeptide (TPR) repeat protein
MNLEGDLEQALRVDAPSLDEAKLCAAVRTRWARQRRRMIGAGVASVAILALGAFVVRARLTPKTPSLTTGSFATTARRPPPSPRPVFALALPLTPQRAAKAVAEEIERLRALLAKTPVTDPTRADILLRLGEAYDEQRRGATGDARATAASAALIQWRAIYDDARYRDYARLDEALFDAAYMLSQENRRDESLTLFQRILDQLPRSRFVPHAALARAETFFENGDMKTALQYYQRVQAYPNSVVYGYASYKVGWAHYNLRENDEALAAFARVIDLGTQGKLEPSSSETMIKECRKDLVLVYSAAGQRDKAWPFFRRYGDRDQALAMLERLASLYDDQGKAAEADATRKEVARLRSMPNNPR